MTGTRVTFDGGVPWLLAFLAVVVVYAVTIQLIGSVWALGPALPLVETNVLGGLLDLGLVGVVWWFLRQEGVRFADIGVSTALVVPGVVTVAVFYLLLNAFGIGLAVATAGLGAVGYQWTVPPVTAVAEFGYYLLVAGIVEELAFRGYLQSKVVALLGGDTRTRVAVGVAVASALFAAIHAPRVLVSGVPGSQTATGYGAILFVSGVGYGVLYELTQNLSVPVLVHAAGDMSGTIGLVFFDVGAFPAWGVVVYLLGYLGLFGVVVLGYRRWAVEADRLPVWTSRLDTTAATA